MGVIAKYKFNSSTYANFIPQFNSEFTDYTVSDINNGDNTITRTISHDTLKPTFIRFGGTNGITDRERSLLEVIECDTSEIQYMDNMFNNCSSLTSLDLSSFNTSNVINVGNMFRNCSSLTSLDLSSFITSKLQYMGNMFWNCSSLTSLDLSSFITSKVNDMNSMFYNCNKLTILDLSNFDTSNVANMNYMFSGCSSLTSLDLSNFDTSKVKNMADMFYNCSSLTSLDLSKFNTSSVTNMDNMFYNCPVPSIKLLYATSSTINSLLTSLGTSTARSIYYLDANLTELTAQSNITYIKYINNSIIYGTIGETAGNVINNENFASNLSKFQVRYDGTGDWLECSESANITNKSNCSFEIKLKDGETLTTMYDMFGYCSSLTSLDLSNFDTSKVINMHYMFSGCSSLVSLDLSNFDISKVINMHYMFNGCSSLTSLDVSSFNTSSVINMNWMFSNCSSLTSLDLSNFDTSSVTNMGYMFYNCSSLTSLDVSNFDTSSVTNMQGMFYKCSSLTSLDLSSFNTSNVTSMWGMFRNCSSLTLLDLSNFDTSSVTDMINIFGGCNKLYSLGLLYSTSTTINTLVPLLGTSVSRDIYYLDANPTELTAQDNINYIEYKETVSTNTITLNGLPNGVCDELDLATGRYVKRVGEMTLDGTQNSSDWNLHAEYGTVTRFNYSGNSYIKMSIDDNSVLCDKFPTIIIGSMDTEGINIHGTVNGQFQLQILTSKASTIAELQTYLATNPITVKYQMLNPVILYPGDEGYPAELASLVTPKSYSNLNNINISSDSLTPSLKYSLKTDNYYDVQSIDNTSTYTTYNITGDFLGQTGLTTNYTGTLNRGTSKRVVVEGTNPIVIKGSKINDVPYFTGLKNFKTKQITLPDGNIGYSVVKNTGKNLFNLKNLSLLSYSTDLVTTFIDNGFKFVGKVNSSKNWFQTANITLKLKYNTNYKLSFTKTSIIDAYINSRPENINPKKWWDSAYIYVHSIDKYGTKKTLIESYSLANDEKVVTFTTKGNTEKIMITWIGHTTIPDQDYEVEITNIQLEEGSTVTEYEPYFENEVYVDEELEMRSLPDGTCDELDLNTGILTRRVGIKLLNGLSNAFNFYKTPENGMVRINYKASSIKGDNDANSIVPISSYLPSRSHSDVWYNSSYGIAQAANGNYFQLALDVERYGETEDVIKKYFQNHPLEVHYKLATEERTQLSLKTKGNYKKVEISNIEYIYLSQGTFNNFYCGIKPISGIYNYNHNVKTLFSDKYRKLIYGYGQDYNESISIYDKSIYVRINKNKLSNENNMDTLNAYINNNPFNLYYRSTSNIALSDINKPVYIDSGHIIQSSDIACSVKYSLPNENYYYLRDLKPNTSYKLLYTSGACSIDGQALSSPTTITTGNAIQSYYALINGKVGSTRALPAMYEGSPNVKYTTNYLEDVCYNVGDNLLVNTGKNLFNGKFELGEIDTDTGENKFDTTRIRCVDYVPFPYPAGTQLYVRFNNDDFNIDDGIIIYCYDSNKKFLGRNNIGQFNYHGIFAGTKYIRFRTRKAFIDENGTTTEITTEELNTLQAQLELGAVATEYEPYKENFITPSLTNKLHLRSLPDGTCDTFDAKTSIITRRVGVISNKSLNCMLIALNQSLGNTILAQFDLPSITKNSVYAHELYCSNFRFKCTSSDKGWLGQPDEETISCGGPAGDRIQIRINKKYFANDIWTISNQDNRTVMQNYIRSLPEFFLYYPLNTPIYETVELSNNSAIDNPYLDGHLMLTNNGICPSIDYSIKTTNYYKPYLTSGSTYTFTTPNKHVEINGTSFDNEYLDIEKTVDGKIFESNLNDIFIFFNKLDQQSGSCKLKVTYSGNTATYKIPDTYANESIKSYITIKGGNLVKSNLKPNKKYEVSFSTKDVTMSVSNGISINLIADGYYTVNNYLYKDSTTKLTSNTNYKFIITIPSDLNENSVYTGFSIGFPIITDTTANAVCTFTKPIVRCIEDNYQGELKSSKLYGKTLVNLCTINGAHSIGTIEGIANFETLSNSHKITITASGSRVLVYNLNQTLKSNTKYIVFSKLINKSFTDDYNIRISFHSLNSEEDNYGKDIVLMNENLNYTIIETTDASDYTQLAIGRHSEMETNDSFEVTFPILLEYQEGMENWDLSYFERMTNVEFNSIKNIGRNLFNYNEKFLDNVFPNIVDSTLTSPVNGRRNFLFNVIPNTEYFIKPITSTHVWFLSDKITKDSSLTINELLSKKLGGMSPGESSFTTPSNCKYILVSVYEETDHFNKSNFYICNDIDYYEPYKENITSLMPKLTKDMFEQGIYNGSSNKTYEESKEPDTLVSHLRRIRSTTYVPVLPNTTYKIKLNANKNLVFNMREYGENGYSVYFNDWQGSEGTITTTTNTRYITLLIRIGDGSSNLLIDDFDINDISIECVLPLRSVPSGVTDELDLVNNKYIKRINEITLTGADSENWTLSPVTCSDGYSLFYNKVGILVSKNSRINILSTLFPTIYTLNCECIFSEVRSDLDNLFFICIKNSRLESNDVAGLKKWLANNPLTVQYEMETPIEYDISLTHTGIPTTCDKPYVFKDGHIILSSNTGILPKLSYKLNEYQTNSFVANGNDTIYSDTPITTALGNLEYLPMIKEMDNVVNPIIFKDIQVYNENDDTTENRVLNINGFKLRSLPNGVSDEIDLVNQVYIQRVGEVVLDGNDIDALPENAIFIQKQYRICNIKKDAFPNIKSGSILNSDKFINCNWGSDKLSIHYDVNIDMNIPVKYTTVESAIAWLNELKPTVQYELDTPIIIPLSEVPELSKLVIDKEIQAFITPANMMVGEYSDTDILPFIQYKYYTDNGYSAKLLRRNTQYTMKSSNNTANKTYSMKLNNDVYSISNDTVFTTSANDIPSDSLIYFDSNYINDYIRPYLYKGDVSSVCIPNHIRGGIWSTFKAENDTNEIKINSYGKNLWVNQNPANNVVSTLNNRPTIVPTPDRYLWMISENATKKQFRITIEGKNNGSINSDWRLRYFLIYEDSSSDIGYINADGVKVLVTKPNAIFKGIYLDNPFNINDYHIYTDTLMIECIENENDEYVYVEPKNNITTFDFTGYELASLPNGVKDELIFDRESRTIKYIKRVEQVVFDGSEDEIWGYNSTYNVFVNEEIKYSDYHFKTDNNLEVVTWNGINRFGYSSLKIGISSNKTGRQYLKNNPVTLYYQLEKPQVIEIPFSNYPYFFKDGLVTYSQYINIEPESTIKLPLNQQHQIQANNETLIRHQKEISYLYRLIKEYINVDYEASLLSLQLEL